MTVYTCTIKLFKLFSERVKRLNYWCSRVFARMKKKLHFSYIDSTQGFWDNDYKDAKETEMFKRSIEICRNLDLVSDNTAFDDIPLLDVGNILLVGMIFDK